MIVRIAKPSRRYAVTTCFDHCFGSTLLATMPSFSNPAQRPRRFGTDSSSVSGGGEIIGGAGASGGTRIGGGAFVTRCIGACGTGSDGAAASALRAALPHDGA